MRQQQPTTPEQLRAWLRSGDPARPMPFENAERIRRHILRQASESQKMMTLRPSWRVAALTACMALLTVVMLWQLSYLEVPSLTPQAVETNRPAVAPVLDQLQKEPVRPYQIQFQTPGGTRIIWLIIPQSQS